MSTTATGQCFKKSLTLPQFHKQSNQPNYNLISICIQLSTNTEINTNKTIGPLCHSLHLLELPCDHRWPPGTPRVPTATVPSCHILLSEALPKETRLALAPALKGFIPGTSTAQLMAAGDLQVTSLSNKQQRVSTAIHGM